MRSARLPSAHRSSMLALVVAVASAALPAAPVSAQRPGPRVVHPGAILVQAVDTSINPIPAEIVIPTFGIGVRLSEEGAAILLNIPDGLYLVQARRLGYRPEWRMARIQGDTARLEFVLPPADMGAGGLADARLRDFLRRSGEMQVGSFITRAEIDRRRPRNLGALLGRIPDISIDGAGPGPSVVRSRRAPRPDCVSGMLLFLDGMLPNPPRLADQRPQRGSERSPRGWLTDRATYTGRRRVTAARWSTTPSARQLAGVEPVMSGGPTSARMSPLDWVPISLVSAVEIYPTVADVPPEFRIAGAECGVVLVWTTSK